MLETKCFVSIQIICARFIKKRERDMQRFLNDKFPIENRSAPLATWKKIFF